MALTTQDLLEEVLRDRETIESLEMKKDTIVLTYDGAVIISGFYWNGPGRPAYFAAIYETLWDSIVDPESDLELVTTSPNFFEDNGHAIAWALNIITGEA